jgi:UDP-N-acetylmuramoyl-tripeptide--D-alanyl-D-alanine ligase
MFLGKKLQRILKVFAKAILRKYQPQIVIIVGSVGKTSTKEAIYTVLERKFKVRRSIKNYNNEIGVPLTILGSPSGEKSFLRWLKIFFRAIFFNIFRDKNYPRILVLEMAADKPGDLKYLMDIISKKLLKVVVLTGIAPVHLEFFGSMDNIFEEKTTPFSYLEKNNFAIINKDDCNLEKVKEKIHSNLLTYGLSQGSDLKAQEIDYDRTGLKFEFKYKDKIVSSGLEGAIAEHQIYSLLGAVAVGISFNISLDESLEALKKYQILPGRMRKLKGIKKTTIIDDTYNSSPKAAQKALQALVDFPFGKRKIAVLGDMLELGQDSEKLHRQVGEIVAKLEIDYLITFGKESKYIFDEARKIGFPIDQSSQFDDIEKVTDFIRNLINSDDILLIKGSRAMKMEEIIKKLSVN